MSETRADQKSDTDKKKKKKKKNKRRFSLRNLWRLGLVAVGVIAVVQELQKPPKKRTWHGKVGDLVPYDFRVPTTERFKTTYWDPDGPFLPGKVFGVGWAVNLGAVKRVIAG